MPCILSLYGLTFVLPRSISMQKQPTSLSLLRNSAQISLWGFGRRILSFIRLNSIWQENHSLRISVGGYGRISYHCCPARLSRGRYRITFRANRNRIFCPPPLGGGVLKQTNSLMAGCLICVRARSCVNPAWRPRFGGQPTGEGNGR
jgi:hypothetical protein